MQLRRECTSTKSVAQDEASKEWTMATGRSFGFESKFGQASYPVLISIMLLIHHYVFTTYPTLKAAEFFLSIILIAGYVAYHKFLVGTILKRFRPQIRLAQKLIEVYIGVTVISSLIHVMIMALFG